MGCYFSNSISSSDSGLVTRPEFGPSSNSSSDYSLASVDDSSSYVTLPELGCFLAYSSSDYSLSVEDSPSYVTWPELGCFLIYSSDSSSDSDLWVTNPLLGPYSYPSS